MKEIESLLKIDSDKITEEIKKEYEKKIEENSAQLNLKIIESNEKEKNQQKLNEKLSKYIFYKK